MSLFKQRRPRRFHHPYMYADERKERLRQIEERARRELGMEAHTDEGRLPHDLRGAFGSGRLHGPGSRQKETVGRRMWLNPHRRLRVPYTLLILLLAVMAVILYWLMNS